MGVGLLGYRRRVSVWVLLLAHPPGLGIWGPALPSLRPLPPPRLQDLEQYAASYSGLMRIERLQFIADHCPPLRAEALKMALSFVQRTFNVDMYEEIHRKLSEATR